MTVRLDDRNRPEPDVIVSTASVGPNATWYEAADEDGDAATVVHVYELDDMTRTYAPVGVFRETLKVGRPFPIELDVQKLYS